MLKSIMRQKLEYLLVLLEQPYENYKMVLKEIKDGLNDPERVKLFERTLMEELPLTTARRAYRSALKIALGEKNVYREWRPADAEKNLKQS